MDILKEIEQAYLVNEKKLNGEEMNLQILQAYMKTPKVDLLELQEVEELFNIKFPTQLKEFYMVHNGSGELQVLSTNTNDYRILSLAAIVEVKVYFQNANEQINQSKDNRIQNFIQNKAWIPFAVSENGSFLMLDYIPTSLGEKGQIIEYDELSTTINYVGNLDVCMAKTRDKLMK